MSGLFRMGPPGASVSVARHVAPCVLVFAILAALPGCRQETAGSEDVKTLEREMASLRERFEAEQERLAEIETKMDELVEENREAQKTVRELEAKLEPTAPELARDIEKAGDPNGEEVAEGVVEAKDEEAVNGGEVAEGGEDAKGEGEAPPAMQKEPTSTEKHELAKERVYDAGGAVVTLTGDKKSGFGVLVTADEKVWIYSAASLVGANMRLKITQDDDSAIEKFGAFELATDADLARLEVPAGPEAALSPGTDAEAVKSASPLLGFDDGLTLDGLASAVEASVIKVSGDLSEQKPGSPVFHGESGELVGVLGAGVGAERSLWPATTGDTRVEPAVYRIDRPLQWTTVPIGTFLQESRAIEETDHMTRLAEAFLALDPAAGALDFGASVGSGATVRDVFAANKSLSVVRSATVLNTWLEESGARASASDFKRKISSTYNEIHSKVRAQIREFERKRFSLPNAPAAAQSLDWCKDADDRLAEFLRGLEED